MLDGREVDNLCGAICDKFTPAELIEMLPVDTQDVFEKFLDEILEIDWSDLL